ncbi:DMT family transporter [Amycolatopsis suaedae]|uniref:DMT family transporter n=1 Tax=Amycolatopsis suaedae TaxID=2510978 RepID=A0A4Q7J6S8_9PSEU|nr:DMT family transporter [Amycolatopsis suaedae]RZQ62847.1 DMT family transporter [Amycolatopsis suaedae]
MTATTPTADPGTVPSGPSVIRRVLGVTLAVVSGIAMAVQGRINGQLGEELHDGLLAAVISFGGGLVLLLAALPFAARMRAGFTAVAHAVREGTLRPWHCLGGLAGALFVAGQSITVVVLGLALFTVGVVAGQTVSSLLVDRAGLGPAGPKALSWTRVLGAGLTLAAVAWSVSAGMAEIGGNEMWLIVLPVAAGACVAVQQAINGRVGAAADNALTATLGNFAVGFVALVLAWLVSLAVRGGPTGVPANPVLYLGGLVGIVFIAVASLVVRWTGVLLLGLAAIAGQLVGSVLLDVVAPARGEHLTASTLGGVLLALVAVVIAGWSPRR